MLDLQDTGRQDQILEIYGPRGLREFLRGYFKWTFTNLGSRYRVHELLFDHESSAGGAEAAHRMELPGPDIRQQDGMWKGILSTDHFTVDAAPIHHSIPCFGFVITELPTPGSIADRDLKILDQEREALMDMGIKEPRSLLRFLKRGEPITLPSGTVLHPPVSREGRKIVILGDTSDASPIEQLAKSPDLLVHEATNCYLPEIDATIHDETHDAFTKRIASRGHSTPQGAGRFAQRIGAKTLIMNHFSARYAAHDERVMELIKDAAASEFAGTILCAKDLMTCNVNRAATAL